jgi:isoleucyl-tRNA synthetase
VLKVRQPLQRILVLVLNDSTKEQVGLVEDPICRNQREAPSNSLDDESESGARKNVRTIDNFVTVG